MNDKIIVVGELHQDLYYESDFYEQLVDAILYELLNFIKFNPDDLLNRKLLEKIIKRGFTDTPKKIIGNCYFKRGGNGNNSSEYLAALGIPTKLVSVIGRGSKWMYPELERLGIDTSGIYKIDEITPVSTIIKSSFTTKIHLAPNLKNKMNFDGITIDENTFKNGKIIFSTPIARKFTRLFEAGHNQGLITAFNIETQKVQSLEKLETLIKNRYDIFFLNLKDTHVILNKKLSVQEVDKIFSKYAKIRVYTAGGEGSYVFTDTFDINYPGIKVDAIVDRTGAGDCFAAGFLAKVYELVENKQELEKFLETSNSNRLKEILKDCIKFASYSAIYKITKQQPPSKEVIAKFMEEFEINN